jgi:histidine triad (HIT) family protein
MVAALCAVAVCTSASAQSTAATGLIGAYDPSNPFARILRGERPVSTVYEDEHALAFIALNMRAPGHTLVIPKVAARTLLDATPETLGHVMRVVRCVAQAQRVALGADGIQLVQNNGAAAGQSVFHLHVHVIPFVPGEPVQPPSVPAASRARMDSSAARLARAMTASDCR